MDTAKISSYLTTRCCKSMDYSFEESIRSCLPFSDEVIVVDSSDKDDGTMEALEALMDEDERIQVFHVEVPWNAPNHGIYDGQMKAYAREQCTGDFLWQMDVDEIAEPAIKEKLEILLPRVNFLQDIKLLTLPVVEFWGGKDKVRIDTNSWKWRLSKKDANITHGIPLSHRWYKDDLLYAKPGADGCEYIDAESGNLINCIHFINQESEAARIAGINNQAVTDQYQFWFQAVCEQLPTVFHFSWWSIASKIKKYREFWNHSWLSLYGEQQLKTEGWNPFFDKPLDQVSDEEIEAKARELRDGCGGWIFHQPWDGTKTNAVKLNVELPDLIKDWAAKHNV